MPFHFTQHHPRQTKGTSDKRARQPQRRLHRIAELEIASHPHFVGRTWELARLGAEFIGAGRDGKAKAKAIALISGLGGIGKTTLCAETLSLWEDQFDWVLCYQAKPNALGFAATLRDMHGKLKAELGTYYQHIQAFPADAIYRDADPEQGFTGPARLQRLIDNLIRAMENEAILLVLDNFEGNLAPHPVPYPHPPSAAEHAEHAKHAEHAEPAWACQDPAWDGCLAQLARAG